MKIKNSKEIKILHLLLLLMIKKSMKLKKSLTKGNITIKTQYLVKWKGYLLSEASWEPESNLHCPELLEAFNTKN